MLKIEKFVTMSPEECKMIIEGMRNPMNSWDRSDSTITEKRERFPLFENIPEVQIETTVKRFNLGEQDKKLAMNLAKNGAVHAKYRRMMNVYLTVRAPMYWWKEFDTYKVGTVANSCSTMHKIASKEFELSDFSWEDMSESDIECLEAVIKKLEENRLRFIETNDRIAWDGMIKLLPSCYEQKRTIMLNYEVLANIYSSRRNHKLKEWHTFCDWIEKLPYSEIITGEVIEK